jgi:hypothetical protein
VQGEELEARIGRDGVEVEVRLLTIEDAESRMGGDHRKADGDLRLEPKDFEFGEQ